MKFNLEQWMQERHINQSQLAAGVGVSKQSVSAWLSGRSLPSKDALEEICLFLDVPIDKLLEVDRTQTRSGKTWRDFLYRFAA